MGRATHGDIFAVFLVALDRQCEFFEHRGYLRVVKVLESKVLSAMFTLLKVLTVVVMQLRHPGVDACSR